MTPCESASRSPQLIVRPASKRELELLLADQSAFAAARGLSPAASLEVFPGSLQFALDGLMKGMPPRWWTYLFIWPPDKSIIGLGGFKGPPNALGIVEIGYAIAPGYRRRGFATEAAGELVRAAAADPSVKRIWAHTLSGNNASTRVLAKNGFRRIAVLSEPEQELWRWEHDAQARRGVTESIAAKAVKVGAIVL